MSEARPLDVDPHAPGTKLDSGKSPVAQGVFKYFPRALVVIGKVSNAGAKKYCWGGWSSVPDGVNRYTNALARHLLAEDIEGEIDADTGQLHAAQVAWNALARLELILREKEKAAQAGGDVELLPDLFVKQQGY